MQSLQSEALDIEDKSENEDENIYKVDGGKATSFDLADDMEQENLPLTNSTSMIQNATQQSDGEQLNQNDNQGDNSLRSVTSNRLNIKDAAAKIASDEALVQSETFQISGTPDPMATRFDASAEPDFSKENPALIHDPKAGPIESHNWKADKKVENKDGSVDVEGDGDDEEAVAEIVPDELHDDAQLALTLEEHFIASQSNNNLDVPKIQQELRSDEVGNQANPTVVPRNQSIHSRQLVESIDQSSTGGKVSKTTSEKGEDKENKSRKKSTPCNAGSNQREDAILGYLFDETSIKPDETEQTVRRWPDKIYRRSKSVRPGKWTLGSKIGSGAFGMVHVGMNTETGSLMAIKSIKMDTAALKDLRREIELMKSIKHVNIVQYFGCQQDRGYLRIFQEWVAGGSVTELLSKFGAFTLDVIQSYLFQIMAGLSYLHKNNIMHRDIKGSNILVTNDGVVKLADFGASRKMVQLQSDLMMSLTMRGTPYFMAPEVFEEKYSTKADIWGVGCVAYQMVTGYPPWKKMNFTNPVSLFNYIKSRQSPPEFELNEACAGTETQRLHFRVMLNKCFAFNPLDRPTADTLLHHPFFFASSGNCFVEQRSFSEDHTAAAVDSPALSIDYFRSPVRRDSLRPRRSSLGVSHILSPVFSPPLPKNSGHRKRGAGEQTWLPPIPSHRSPTPDTSGWPTWAKEKFSLSPCVNGSSEAQRDAVGVSENSTRQPFVEHDDRAVSKNRCARTGLLLDDSLAYTCSETTEISNFGQNTNYTRAEPAMTTASDCATSRNGRSVDSREQLGGLDFVWSLSQNQLREN
ncbi:hypothetical protein ACA910_014555 [Epithemia clementina (nom. ined.)]